MQDSSASVTGPWSCSLNVTNLDDHVELRVGGQNISLGRFYFAEMKQALTALLFSPSVRGGPSPGTSCSTGSST